MQRLPRIVTPLLFVILCALAVWWVVRLMPGQTIAVPPVAVTDPGASGSRADAVLASARLFGSRPPGVLSDNVRALGVIADASGHGSVIVSVDGQAPKVYRVGDTLDGRLVAAIRPEEIELEASGARQVFRLPPARPSATGLTIQGTADPALRQPPVYGPPESRYQAPLPEVSHGQQSDLPPGASPMERRIPARAGLLPPPLPGSNR